MSSKHVIRLMAFVPPVVKTLFKSIFPADMLVFVLFQLSYSKTLKLLHKIQSVVCKLLALDRVYEWKDSILGFAEKKGIVSLLYYAC